MHSNYRFAAWRCASVSAVLWFSTLLSAQPVVTLSPTSLNFGNQQVGTTSSAQVVTLTNTGTATLFLNSIKLSGLRTDYSQTNTCGGSLAVNASCVISVTFTPTKIGSRTSSVSIGDNAAGSPQTVPLSGTGVAPAVSLSTESLSFTGVLIGRSSSAKSFTVTNSGNATLTISSVVAGGDFSQTNTCAAPVGVGASCTITVTFSPTAAWSRSGSIVITDDSYSGSQQVVLLVGMGNSGALARLSTKTMSFSNQNLGTTSPAKTITLSSVGTAALNINSILASGDFSQTNNCPASLATTATCTINVTFAPTTTGKRTGAVTINDTDPTYLQTTNLTGTGVVASSAVTVNPEEGSITPSQTQQFAATVNGVSSSNVTWSVDGIVGGNSTVGTISTLGLYTPPATSAVHIIQAANIAKPTQTAVAFLAVTNYAGTFTNKNDTLRTGQNLSEIALTTANVNQFQFGKLFSYPVDGYVFAQPLYVEGVNIPGEGIHNVVYVATEGDSVYAFDADNNGEGGGQLWKASFVNAANGVTTIPQGDVEDGDDIPDQIGITATPVIDPAINTLFVVARTKEVSNGVTSYVQRLHALDITTGAEQPGSPVVIEGSVSGTGVGSVGGTLSFDPLRENPRPGLLLANGTVYIGWGSLEDIDPFHGWLMGYNETTLQQVSVFCTTPNGNDGGIWQGGGGIAADGNGNIFLETGNGTFDANTSGVDYGETVVKFTTTGGILSVADYFSPFDQATLSTNDWDLAAGGEMLLPDQAGTYPHVMLAAGKGSTIYELNRDALGGFNTTANLNLLTVPAVIGGDLINSGNRAGGPAYWQGQVYYAGSNSYPMQFSLQGSLISTLPIAQSSKLFPYPGGSPTVSANGSTNGIVWLLQTDNYATSGAAKLRAFDASNVSRELYDSAQNASRDAAGPSVKFTVPTVANGKVYVGTQTELDVYGLLP